MLGRKNESSWQLWRGKAWSPAANEVLRHRTPLKRQSVISICNFIIAGLTPPPPALLSPSAPPYSVLHYQKTQSLKSFDLFVGKYLEVALLVPLLLLLLLVPEINHFTANCNATPTLLWVVLAWLCFDGAWGDTAIIKCYNLPIVSRGQWGGMKSREKEDGGGCGARDKWRWEDAARWTVWGEDGEARIQTCRRKKREIGAKTEKNSPYGFTLSISVSSPQSVLIWCVGVCEFVLMLSPCVGEAAVRMEC